MRLKHRNLAKCATMPGMTRVEQILILDRTLSLLAFWSEEIGDSPDDAGEPDEHVEPPQPGEDRSQDQLTATLDWQYRLFDERRQELLWSLSEEELKEYESAAKSS